MKKSAKLSIKKVTLRNLDEPTLNGLAGGATTPETVCATCICTKVGYTCRPPMCVYSDPCAAQK